MSTFLKFRSAYMRGLFPATSPCNKWQGQVSSYEMAICASKSSRRTNFSPCDYSHEFKPVWIFGTSPCDLFLKTLPVNCSWIKSLQSVPSCKLLRGLVPLCVPTFIEHQNHDFSYTFTVNFAVFAPQPRWRRWPWNLLLELLLFWEKPLVLNFLQCGF